ncbi:nitroreductase [soil metagenome]
MDHRTDAADLLDELLIRRHSCRAFLPGEVPAETIERLFRAAGRTASWCNTQPWQLFLSGPAATAQLRGLLEDACSSGSPAPDLPFPAGYEGVHLARRRASGFQLYEAVGIKRGDREAADVQARRNFAMFDAPHVVIVTVPSSLVPYALVDCGGWVANFLLAAEAHGVSAIPQAALASYSDVLRAFLDIPDELLVVCGISFGWGDREHPVNGYRTARADIGETLHRR